MQLFFPDASVAFSEICWWFCQFSEFCREGTYFLIVDHLSGQSQYILSALRSHPESLFLYLKTVIEVNTTGNLNLSSLKNDNNLYFPSARRPKQQSSSVEAYLQTISGFPKLLHNSSVQITDEMTELYLEVNISKTIHS